MGHKMSEDYIDFDLTIDIDCFNCGENTTIRFRLGVQRAEYTYCNSCGEGIGVLFEAHTLRILRLAPIGDY